MYFYKKLAVKKLMAPINYLSILVGLMLTDYTYSNHLSDTDYNVNRNFKSVPTTYKTYENDTVLLPCYHHREFSYVRWFRRDIVIADSRQPNLKLPDRVTLFNNGSLQVANLISKDTAEFVCEIMTPEGLARQDHAIEVQHAPTIVSEPSGSVELPIGSIIEIVCEARGIPQPIITWRRNGINVTVNPLQETRRFEVNVKDKDMAGRIECIAHNGVGEPAVAGINLIVLFTPEVKAVPSVVHTTLYIRAQLECHVTSAPPPKINWYHHGVPVLKDNRITRQDTDLNTNNSLIEYYSQTRHVLIIRKVKESDLGTYECRADNKIGFKGVTLELTGRPLPSTFKPSPSPSTPMTHNLIWQTESLSQILEYKLKFRQIPSGNITPQSRFNNINWTELMIPPEISEGSIHTIGYTLSGLAPASVYEVAVTSRNRYGWSDISTIIRFATGGEIQLPIDYSTEIIDYDVVENYSLDYISPGYAPTSGGPILKIYSLCFLIVFTSNFF